MQLHGTTHDAALVLVERLAQHLPPTLDVGAPAIVTDRDVLTDRGELIALDTLDDPTGIEREVGSRTVVFGDGITEVTSWHLGREVDRQAARVRDAPGADWRS